MTVKTARKTGELKITEFDRDNVVAFEKELQDVAKKHGFEVTSEYKFNIFEADFKLRFTILDTKASLEAKQAAQDAQDAANFTAYASTHGLPIDALGQEFAYGGEYYKIIGFSPNDKRGVRIKKTTGFGRGRRSLGNVYRMTAAEVKKSFEEHRSREARYKKLNSYTEAEVRAEAEKQGYCMNTLPGNPGNSDCFRFNLANNTGFIVGSDARGVSLYDVADHLWK